MGEIIKNILLRHLSSAVAFYGYNIIVLAWNASMLLKRIDFPGCVVIFGALNSIFHIWN